MCMRWPRWGQTVARPTSWPNIDNDEDGEVDDPNVLEKLYENKAYLVL